MEFPSNSKAPRPQPPASEERKVESVVTNEVETQKKSLLKRFAGVFIGGDTKSVANYVLMDVLLPQAREMLSEAVGQGVERMIYGDSRPSRRNGVGRRPGGPVNYSGIAVRGNNPLGRAGAADRDHVSPRAQGFDTLLFVTRVEAETVLERMYDLLEKYESVSVSDLKSLIDKSSSYTDQKWGWLDLAGSRIHFNRKGYALELPNPVSLD